MMAAPDRALPGVGQPALERVHVLALVELPGDAPPQRLVSQIPGGEDGAAQRTPLFDRRGEGVLLPLRRAQFPDDQSGGGVPALPPPPDPPPALPPRPAPGPVPHAAQ